MSASSQALPTIPLRAIVAVPSRPSCRLSLQAQLAAYGRRLQAPRQADRFDLVIFYFYAKLLPFLYDYDDVFFPKVRSRRLSLILPLLVAKAERLMAPT